MSDNRTAEIEARLAKATPGPWKTEPVEQGRFAGIEARVYSLRGSHVLLSPTDGEAGQAKTTDAEFIANAPEDVRYLLAERAKLRAEVAYQKARAAYFKYVPEIEHDPEGVQELVEEMRAAREAYFKLSGSGQE